MRFWQSWDEEERAAAVRIAGLCVAALTLGILCLGGATQSNHHNSQKY